MTRKHFERLVAQALRDIPESFREAMENVALVVEDYPQPELLEEMGIEPPDTLYGLYQGTPLPERDWSHGNVLPDTVISTSSRSSTTAATTTRLSARSTRP